MTFQDQLNLLRAGDVPIPLMSGQATAQAVRLRATGLSYGSISMVMATYHGWRLSGAAWHKRCREAGSPPKHYADGSLRQFKGLES
jgi:hypothetical protein